MIWIIIAAAYYAVGFLIFAAVITGWNDGRSFDRWWGEVKATQCNVWLIIACVAPIIIPYFICIWIADWRGSR